MDARPADGEPISQGFASPYAQAALRRFAHFSASRNDTRAQFRRWLSGEPLPSFRFADPGLEPRANSPAPPLLQERAEGDPAGEIVPEWLSPAPQRFSPVQQPLTPAEETGQGEREGTLADAAQRVASHWLLLNEVFAPPRDAERSPERASAACVVPALAAFSIAGGTGKTTLLATLGRALAARGERILLADTAPLGLASCYFGARPAGPFVGRAGGGPAGSGSAHEAGATHGSVRTFAPPRGSHAAPVDILPLGGVIDAGISPADNSDPIRKTLLRHGGKADRILVDIQSGWEPLVRRLFWLKPIVLAPLLPDMNSVASVMALQAAFSRDLDAGAMKLVYLLNQYDASIPLHLDVRGALEGRLGDRLLPFVVRRSPEVSEALAEGMTVIDYAPDSAAAEDYARLADWVSGAAPSALPGLRQLRWSEQ